MKPTVATLNFTERHRIERRDVRITGHTSGAQGYFLLEKLEVGSLGLDPSAVVVIECFTGKIGFQRYIHGPLADIESCASNQHQFPSTDLPNATFRVKIVSCNSLTKGRILADANDIPVEFGGRPPSLLGVDPADIGELVWALDISEETGPILQINERLPDPQQIARDTEFRATVMPKIVAEIAFWVAEKVQSGEADSSATKWKRALSQLPGINFDTADTSTVEHRTELADRVSHAWAKQHDSVNKFKNALERRQQ